MRVGTSQKLEMEYKGYRDHPHACGDKRRAGKHNGYC